MAYVPDKTIRWFHELPRYTFDRQEAPKDPTALVDALENTGSAQDNAYLQGVASTAMLVLLVGIGFFVITFLLYALAALNCGKSCRWCKRQRTPDKTGRVSTFTRKTRLNLLVIAAAAAMSSFAIIFGLNGVADGIDSGMGLVDQTLGIIEPIHSTSVDLQADCVHLDSNVDAFDQAIQNNQQASQNAALADLPDTLHTSSNAINSAAGMLESLSSNVVSTLNKAHDNTDTVSSIKDYLKQGGNGLVAAAVVIVGTYLATGMIPLRICKLLFFIFSFLALFILLIMWTAMGTITVLTVTVSDACIDPQSLVIALAPVLRDTVEYYSTCTDATARSGLAGEAASVISTLTTASTNFSSTIQDIGNYNDQQLTTTSAAVGVSFAALASDAGDLLVPTSCSEMGGLYRNIFKSLCNDVVGGGLNTMYIALMIVCALASLMLIAGLPIAFLHPSSASVLTRKARKERRKSEALRIDMVKV
jgi:hypothetical protein